MKLKIRRSSTTLKFGYHESSLVIGDYPETVWSESARCGVQTGKVRRGEVTFGDLRSDDYFTCTKEEAIAAFESALAFLRAWQ